MVRGTKQAQNLMDLWANPWTSRSLAVPLGWSQVACTGNGGFTQQRPRRGWGGALGHAKSQGTNGISIPGNQT